MKSKFDISCKQRLTVGENAQIHRIWSIFTARNILHRVPKLAIPLVSNTYNSACTSWISTDEKVFTVATPVNSQNDRIYSSSVKKAQIPTSRLVREREHFSHKVMVVSVGVSKIGKSSVVFVNPGA